MKIEEAIVYVIASRNGGMTTDQIADAIVTDCLIHDKNSRVAIECLLKNNTIIIGK